MMLSFSSLTPGALPTMTGPCVSLREQPSPQGKPMNSISNPSFPAQSLPASLNMEDLHISQWPAHQKRTQSTPRPSTVFALGGPFFFPYSLCGLDFNMFSEALSRQQCLMNAFE